MYKWRGIKPGAFEIQRKLFWLNGSIKAGGTISGSPETRIAQM
ncbi:MAG TPA: hypothetical protein VN455_01380 [Methanotrichaceae archaeon]|nr:hypothetical protein [Methanotrichaceae archaeon]